MDCTADLLLTLVWDKTASGTARSKTGNGLQQAREVAIAGLQPVEGVWVPIWQLAPAKEGHGVLWGQCGMWQLQHLYRWCSVGVPAPAKLLSQGPVATL